MPFAVAVPRRGGAGCVGGGRGEARWDTGGPSMEKGGVVVGRAGARGAGGCSGVG